MNSCEEEEEEEGGRAHGAPWGVTPSPPSPGPLDLLMPGPRDLLCPQQHRPHFLFLLSLLPPAPFLLARPVLVCHDNKWMLMEAAVAVGLLQAPSVPPSQHSTLCHRERGLSPPGFCHGEGVEMGRMVSLPLPSPLPSPASLLKYREIIYI